jgi:valine--pyruvate aminotransferase
VARTVFTSSKPRIQLLPNGQFKYQLDTSAPIPAHAAALCISRPTNPSGNVLSDAEVRFLDEQAQARGIPLIIDAAYGLPFPALHHGNDTHAYWSDNVLWLLSLSKVGMPGVRSGFLIANPDFVAAFSRANTILNLAPGNLGPALAQQLLQQRGLQQLSKQVLQPWYANKAQLACKLLSEALHDIPHHIHQLDGAFFLWLWLPELRIPTQELYRVLKAAGLLVIPGENSFMGLSEPWAHSQQCLRLSYAVAEEILERGARILRQVLGQV